MAGGIWSRLKAALGRDGGIRRGIEEGGKARWSGEPTTDGGTTVGLYECPRCEITYVSEEMESCRSCKADVEPIANERELGLL